MKHLNQCILESLLDDEDDIMSTAYDKTIENLIDNINDAIGARHNWGKIKAVSIIENALCISGEVSEFKVDAKMADMILDLHKVKPFDELSVTHNITFENDRLLDGKIIKTIRCERVFLSGQTSVVKNVDFDLENPSLALRARFTCYSRNITLENVNIWMEDGSIRDRMRFDGIPTLKNFKAHNVSRVVIYSPSAFDQVSIQKKMNEFFDPTYKYVIDDVGGKMISRKGDLKTIVATVNNPRKYVPLRIVGNPFSISKSAKLTDIIDLKCFDDELNGISISNNNVEFEFRKDKTAPAFTTFRAFLPNDKGWELFVYKRP